MTTREDLEDQISRNTWAAVEQGNFYVAHALAYAADLEVAKRRAQQKCRRCYYLRSGRLAGQAFTYGACKLCALEMTFPTTHQDDLCLHCGQQNALCVECCADIDFATKRVNWPRKRRRKKAKPDMVLTKDTDDCGCSNWKTCSHRKTLSES